MIFIALAKDFYYENTVANDFYYENALGMIFNIKMH